MSGIYISLLHIVAGFILYSGIQHLLLHERNRSGYAHLLFTAVCFMIAGLIVIRIAASNAETVDVFIFLRRLEVVFASLSCLSLMFFISEYTSFWPKNFFLVMSAFWLALIIASLVLPYGVQLLERPGALIYQELPWGEIIVDLRVVNRGLWHQIGWLAIGVTLFYGIYAAQMQYRSGDKDKGRLMFWAMAVFFILAMFDTVINLFQLNFVHTSNFGFLAMIVMMDIELQHESKRKKIQMTQIFDNLPAGLCIKDTKGHYELTNRAFRDFFASTIPVTKDLRSLSDADLFPKDLCDRIALNEQMILDQGENIESTFTYMFNGELLSFNLQQFLVEGNVRGASTIGALYFDITQDKQKDEMLEKLRNQGWFYDRVSTTGAIAKSLAHELCQPLSAILNNAQAGLRFMQVEPVDHQEITDIFEDIVRDEKRAGAIINLIRAMLQQKETVYTNIDLGSSVKEVIDLLHTELIHKHIHLEYTQEANLLVSANTTQMQQVILNLIINAIEAMEQKSPVQRSLVIQAMRVDSMVVVSVRDNGTGIPEACLEKIFDGFYTTKEQGLGVGLEVCKAIMEAHRGKIWAQNNQDQGVTFFVSLPLVKFSSND